MKNIFSILAAVLLTASVFAQTPNEMSYQAVIRDANNNLLKNQSIGMRVSIIVHWGPTPHILYQETYTPNPQTNANGLVTVEIGSGTPVTGTFSGINWTLGTYSIQTETDPNGGTNYTITGTSPLLSVPFAVNANKADSTNFSKYAGKADSVKYSNPITAGNKITITGSGTTASPYLVNVSAHYIGENFGGGIVFFVYDNGQHGLIAAATDQSTGMRWSTNGIQTFTLALANGLGAGKTNTALIIASLGVSDGSTYAARVCNEYSITVNGIQYSDWYLPSTYELNLMWSNIGLGAAAPNTNIGGFAATFYWSSEESSNVYTFLAKDYFFTSPGSSGIGTENKSISSGHVRAIRAF